jgi:hypothetical protein
MRTTKLCTDCGLVKPQSEFYESIAVCKPCWRARVRQRRLTDPKVQEYDRERAKLPRRREMAKAISKRWRKKYPDGYRAHCVANNAIRDGKLQRQPCQVCGTFENVHKHHRNYTRPLDVTFLCAKCHHRLHAIFPEISGHLPCCP